MPKRIVYLGTKSIGAICFQFLLEQKEVLDLEIIAVGTKERKDMDSEITVAQLAKDNNIPILPNADGIPECDFIYSVQYHEILKAEHIAKARKAVVNLHLAPLPDYRGCNQFSFAIANEAKEFGVTIHQIDTGIDSGAILFEDRFDMPTDIWVKDLVEMSIDKGITLFKATLSQLLNGEYLAVPQSELLAERGSHLYFRKDIEKLKVIDLSADKPTISRAIRATYMPNFELPYVIKNGQKQYIAIEDYL